LRAETRLTRDHPGSNGRLTVSSGQCVDGFMRVQPTWIGHDPEASPLEIIWLFAHDCFRDSERGPICSDTRDRYHLGIVITNEGAESQAAFLEFVLREFGCLRRRSMYDVGDPDTTISDVTTIIFCHADTSVDWAIDNPGTEQGRIEPIARVSEMSCCRCCPEARVDPHEQQVKAGSKEVVDGRPFERLQLGARESHVAMIACPRPPGTSDTAKRRCVDVPTVVKLAT